VKTTFKVYRCLLWVFVITVLIPATTNAQQTGSAAINQRFDAKQADNLQEKIFVHTDKDFYLAGEILWFKLYCVDGFFHRPLSLSKVAYVELIAATGQPALQARIALNDAAGAGSFVLPSYISSGNYLLRAYTSRMKNYPAEFYFEKTVTVVNTGKAPGVAEYVDTASFDLQVLPEGGNLVEGLESRVAFRATDERGRGRNGYGAVLNKSGDTVARFNALYRGMGSFLFTPQANESYRVVYFSGSKPRARAVMPAVYANGYVIKLTRGANRKPTIEITARGATAQHVNLFIHTRGVKRMAARINLLNNHASYSLDTEKLGDGISVITLLTEEGQPLCERLYFKRPSTGNQLLLTTDKEQAGSREKVLMRIAVNDSMKWNANMSMAVYLVDSLQKNSPADIASYLWLQSDIAGHIEEPAYYLSNDAGAEEAADLLMMTQGWRRFEWERSTQAGLHTKRFDTEYAGPVINATIRNPDRGAGSTDAWLAVPGTHFYVAADSTNADGQVQFRLPVFYGNGELVLQSGSPSSRAPLIQLKNPFSETYSSYRFKPLVIDTSWKKQLNDRSIAAQVQQTYSDSFYQVFDLPLDTDTIPFYGKPDMRYMLDDYTRFVTMEEVLREYVAEVRLRRQGDQFRITLKNEPYQAFFDNTPLILMDGVPVRDVNKLIATDPLKIRKLDVLARKFYLGSRVHDGLLSFSSYEGDQGTANLDSNAVVIDYEGLQLQRRFYAPVYDNAAAISGRLPDFRNVLMWMPYLTMDINGKRTTEFYTSDLSGTYLIVVQGIAPDGTPVTATHAISVKGNGSIR
jgi:hypothetical protein